MEARDVLAQAARYRHPAAGAWGRMVGALVANRHWTAWRRWLVERWPVPALASDVVDVAYMNWWVEAAALPPAPPGYRYAAWAGRTPFTILSYRHGHFGPELAGPLRRLFPSPLQSNWRWYLQREDDPADAAPTVLFVRNAMDSLAHVVGARLWSDAMQPHLPARFTHDWQSASLSTHIAPGQGSAPALDAVLALAPETKDGKAWWRGRFADAQAAIRFLACQELAIAVAPDGRAALTRIALPVDLDNVRMLAPQRVDCPLLDGMGGADGPFCFLLPKAAFRVVCERLL